MSLRDDQSTIARWIRAPEGVAKALADDPHPDQALARLTGLIRSNERRQASDRLDIYANAHFYRILGVLKEDYEALHYLLGDSLFNDLVTSYMLVEPSRHPSLRYVGARLPKFLAAHASAEGLRNRAAWAPDLSRLELSRVDVFDVANGEVLLRDELVAMAPEDFSALELQLGPWAQVCSFEYPVDELWRMGTRGEASPDSGEASPESGEASPESIHSESVEILIWRQEERVRHQRVDGLEAKALARIEHPTRFDSLCDWAAGQISDDEAPTQVASWLESWLSRGLLRNLAGRS